jgi:prephenate dehydrogenase
VTSTPHHKLRIGIVGFGNFGQFIAKTFAKAHDVFVTNRDDVTASAAQTGCKFFPWFDMENFLSQDLDVLVIAVSILSFEVVLKNLPLHLLDGMLVVDVLSVKVC